MNNMSVPAWGWWLITVCLLGFTALVVLSVKRNHGVKRSMFAAPYVLWMIVFTVLPIILIAYYAFTDANGAFTLNNFQTFWDSNFALRQRQILKYGAEKAAQMNIQRGTVNIDTLTYSLWMAVLCTLVCLIMGYPAALFMADRKMKLGPSLVVLFVIPMWMNFLLRTIAWMSLLEDNGLINNLLDWLGLGRRQLMYNQQAVLLGMVYNFLPFMVFPIYTSLSKLDPKLEEAAADLGCNPMQTLSRVTVPLSLPGVISGITMVFMPSVTTFIIPRLLGGGTTQMIGDLIENYFILADDWNLGSALSLVMMVMILISLAILRKADPNAEGGGIG